MTHSTRSSFVQLIPLEKDYGHEALERFRQLTEVNMCGSLKVPQLSLDLQGQRLIANVDQREGQLLHLRLIDPQDPNSATDPMACLNADLVREGKARIDLQSNISLADEIGTIQGLATIDKTCRYASAYPQVIGRLKQGKSSRASRAQRLT